MEHLEALESHLNIVYDAFYRSVGIEESTGKVLGTNQRFSGKPYLGKLYPTAKKRILFIGMDIGADEGHHSFSSRRKAISSTENGIREIPYKKPFNPHISGTYAMSLALLYHDYKWDKIWRVFSSIKDRTAYRAIQVSHKILPVDLLDLISMTNLHKFVTINRKNRSGSQDRNWKSPEVELKLLKDEISILKPNIIVIQSLGGNYLKNILDINKDVRVIVTAHPAARSRYYRSIAYIESLM